MSIVRSYFLFQFLFPLLFHFHPQDSKAIHSQRKSQFIPVSPSHVARAPVPSTRAKNTRLHMLIEVSHHVLRLKRGSTSVPQAQPGLAWPVLGRVWGRIPRRGGRAGGGMGGGMGGGKGGGMLLGKQSVRNSRMRTLFCCAPPKQLIR